MFVNSQHVSVKFPSNMTSVFTELNLWHCMNVKYHTSLPAPQQLKSLWGTTSDLRCCHFLKYTTNARSCNILDQYDWDYSFSKYKSGSGTVLFSPFTPKVLHASLLVKLYCLVLYKSNFFFCLSVRRTTPAHDNPAKHWPHSYRIVANYASKHWVKWMEKHPRSFHWGLWKEQFPKWLAAFLLP